jgi:hypothetical protein
MSFLAGLIIPKTAQPFTLPHRKLIIVARGFLPLMDTLTPSFPNPVPPGTYVPHWALIDVTVRCSSFRLRGIPTLYPRHRTTGIPINRMPPAVGTLLFLRHLVRLLTTPPSRFQIILKWLLAR